MQPAPSFGANAFAPSGFGLVRSLSVARKLLLVTLIFAAAIVLLIAGSIHALRTQEADAAIADALGRQRFLNVRYYVDAMQTAAGAPMDYQASRELFDQNLDTMLTGGTVVVDPEKMLTAQVPPPPNEAVLNALRAQKAASARLVAAMNRYLALPEAQRRDLQTIANLAELRIETSSQADAAARHYINFSHERTETFIAAAALLGIISILVGGLAALLVGRSIVGPLGDCVALARNIAEGNLAQKPLAIRSSDEIGTLTTAFNAMLVHLRAITEETRETAARVTASVQEIQASIQEQASSAREQAAAVQEITTTVEEIGQSAQQVAEMARDVGSSAEIIAGSSQSGLSAVRDAASAMEAIRTQTESVSETIVALSERTQAIGEIINTVNEIAEQSNLVAINAAIEAAGAGEQGRRFSVVANEIKALADQSRDATRQVRSILEQTQRNISSSVLLTEEALKRVVVGREKAVAAEETIRQIAGGVQDTSGSFQQVAGATGQQQIGLEQIAQSLQQIRQASMQATGGTDQLAKAAENLSQLGSALNRLMETYRL